MTFRPGQYRLGDLLIAQGFCTPDDIASSLKHQPYEEAQIGEILIRLGVCTRQQIAETLKMQAVAAAPIWEVLERLAWHPEMKMIRLESEVVAGVPRHGSYLRFSGEEFRLAELLAEKSSFQDILNEAWRSAHLVVTPDHIVSLAQRLLSAGLLYDTAAGLPKPHRPSPFAQPWLMRMPLVDPAPLLDRLMPILKRTTSMRFLCFAWGPLVLSACLVAALHGGEMGSAIQASWSMTGVPAILEAYLAISLVVLVHELGHAAVAHALGAPVHELGLMLYLGLPLGYTNVSAANLLERRHDRIAVSLGGLYYQIGFSALAILAWAWVPMDAHGKAFVLSLALISGGSVVFDLNPFAKMDGYYVLSDWLGIRNLQGRSWDYLRQRLQGKPTEALDQGQRRLFLGYALASIGMAILLFVLAIAGWVWLAKHL